MGLVKPSLAAAKYVRRKCTPHKVPFPIITFWTKKCQTTDLNTFPTHLELRSNFIENVIKVFDDQESSRFDRARAEDRVKSAYHQIEEEITLGEKDIASYKKNCNFVDEIPVWPRPYHKKLVDEKISWVYEEFFRHEGNDIGYVKADAIRRVEDAHKKAKQEVERLEDKLEELHPLLKPALPVSRNTIVPRKKATKFVFDNLWIGYNSVRPQVTREALTKVPVTPTSEIMKPLTDAESRESTYRKVAYIEFWEVHSGKSDGDAELSEPAPKLMTIHYDQAKHPVKAVTTNCKGYTLNDAAKNEPYKKGQRADEKGHVMIRLDSKNGWGGAVPKFDGKRPRSPFDPNVRSGHLYFSGTEADTDLLNEYFKSEEFTTGSTRKKRPSGPRKELLSDKLFDAAERAAKASET